MSRQGSRTLRPYDTRQNYSRTSMACIYSDAGCFWRVLGDAGAALSRTELAIAGDHGGFVDPPGGVLSVGTIRRDADSDVWRQRLDHLGHDCFASFSNPRNTEASRSAADSAAL